MTGTSTTIIPVTLPEKTTTLLKEKADASGVDVADLAGRLIQDALRPKTAPTGTVLDEILRPVRDQYEASGMSDDDLDSLVEETREDIWNEKRSKKSQ